MLVLCDPHQHRKSFDGNDYSSSMEEAVPCKPRSHRINLEVRCPKRKCLGAQGDSDTRASKAETKKKSKIHMRKRSQTVKSVALHYPLA